MCFTTLASESPEAGSCRLSRVYKIPWGGQQLDKAALRGARTLSLRFSEWIPQVPSKASKTHKLGLGIRLFATSNQSVKLHYGKPSTAQSDNLGDQLLTLPWN